MRLPIIPVPDSLARVLIPHIRSLVILFIFSAAAPPEYLTAHELPRLKVADNKRFIQMEDGTPFFWLGDTGWHLFSKLTREEAAVYLDNRQQKGFNVIQSMVIPGLPLSNAYGSRAFEGKDISRPVETAGNDPADSIQYDYWDHIDYIIDLAEQRGIYIALVPIWGTVAKQKECTLEQITVYIEWLVKRFVKKSNIIWLNGGDIKGSVETTKWERIGHTIRHYDTLHLISYHPFGRTQSSTWFHNASWLDFNMFQSGHRAYDQKKGDGEESGKGEDNWRYVIEDLRLNPSKPTLDGEPSYENIPHGLHDTTQPYWTAADCRRYAYWSVLAGSLGHTYGDNAVMQMHKPNAGKPAYGPRNYWFEAINDSGSFQMIHLKRLILSRPYFNRVYDSTLIVEQGARYGFIPAARGSAYLFAYTYTGSDIVMRGGKISGGTLNVYWYNPRTGEATYSGTIANRGILRFHPPQREPGGSDWVLVLDDTAAGFSLPGK